MNIEQKRFDEAVLKHITSPQYFTEPENPWFIKKPEGQERAEPELAEKTPPRMAAKPEGSG